MKSQISNPDSHPLATVTKISASGRRGRPQPMRLIRGSELTDSDLTDFPVSTAIPIAQALPPIALRVLAWTGHRWTVATRHSRWIDGVTGHIIEPTHWQHLPAAPQ